MSKNIPGIDITAKVISNFSVNYRNETLKTATFYNFILVRRRQKNGPYCGRWIIRGILLYDRFVGKRFRNIFVAYVLYLSVYFLNHRSI